MRIRRKTDLLRYLGIMSILLCGAGIARASECRMITEEVQAHIETYLSQRHGNPSNRAKPKIMSTALVPNSCYWKIKVMFADVKEPVTVYLSPDQRFITPALYDLTVDPAAEVASISREVNEFLLQDRSPSLPGSKSQINLVEFSDLQCPYCKRFSNWYDSLPAELKNQTTLIYKHFPLPQHSWARMASIYAACSGTISPAAFWRVTHRLFEIQSEVTVGSLNDEVLKAFGSSEDGNVKALKACVDSGAGSTLVDRDIATAKQLAVSVTPTVFINGRRVMHIRSEEALEELIRSTLTQQTQLNEKSTASSRSRQ